MKCVLLSAFGNSTKWRAWRLRGDFPPVQEYVFRSLFSGSRYDRAPVGIRREKARRQGRSAKNMSHDFVKSWRVSAPFPHRKETIGKISCSVFRTPIVHKKGPPEVLIRMMPIMWLPFLLTIRQPLSWSHDPQQGGREITQNLVVLLNLMCKFKQHGIHFPWRRETTLYWSYNNVMSSSTRHLTGNP